ncbi:MAG: DUF1292 domain-containing protein [Acutalibacteraceae bacterium]
MSELLDKLNDEELDFTVTITDTDGVTADYEFLDIVCFGGDEYAVLSPLDSDGYVDIFKIVTIGSKENYVRQTDEKILDGVFEIFKIKNEDEFDFE